MASGRSPSKKRDSAGGSCGAVQTAPAFCLACFTFYWVWIWDSMLRSQPQDSYIRGQKGWIQLGLYFGRRPFVPGSIITASVGECWKGEGDVMVNYFYPVSSYGRV